MIGRNLPILLLLFFLSGCAALVYEIVFFQLLRQVIGASAVSLAIVLASFMGGMCLGSLGFPRLADPARHPLRTYAVLEAGIAATAVAMLVVLPLVGSLYVSVVGYGFAGILLRSFVCLLCLLPPTMLMGATLPAISRCLETTRIGVSRLGLFYMANIVGGVAGCLIAGFYLLRLFDLVVATLAAASLNAIVAGVSLWMSSRTEFDGRAASELAIPSVSRRRSIHIVIAISGATALGAQVVWTRLLSMVFGATVFSFTIILAVFLAGLGAGSTVGSLLVRHIRSPRQTLGWCQLGLTLAIPFAAHLITSELPFWQLNPELASNTAQRFAHDLLRGAVAILPATLLWGASFPLALAAAAEDRQEPAHLAGHIYAANTMGAILGALLFSMVMIPVVGTTTSQQILTALSGVAAFTILLPRITPLSWKHVGLAAAGVLGLVWLTASTIPPVSSGLIAFGREVEKRLAVDTYLFTGEGANSSVVVADYGSEDVRSFHVAGKSVASTNASDLRLQRMLGHLPALFHPGPKSVLVVGFGAGITAGSFVLYPEIERIVICEIEPLVTQAAGEHFASENYDVLNDPRVEVVFDDARHFMATTDEKFDIITADPIHPWMDGSAALFSLEYYELVKQRLVTGGLFAQWVPLYETDEETVKSEIGTFIQAFPDGTLWSSHIPRLGGNDLVMLGGLEAMRIDVSNLSAKIEESPAVAASLADVDLGYVVTLLASFIGRGPDLEAWLEGAQINHERSLRLQYLASMSFESIQDADIYRTIARYRSYPDTLIFAPDWIKSRLIRIWN